ncbi:MAG: ATP-binding protein [Chloroflexota bacterium]
MRIEKDGETRPLPASSTARSLFAHLLFHNHEPQSRAALTGLFWPELDETRARRALSQALWQIRRAFPDLLAADADSVTMAAAAPLWVDAREFERLAAREAARHELEQALDLYRADFLEGDFHDWALLERERLRELFLQALGRLEGLEKAAGRFAKALDLAQRLSRAEPLNESAHREVMRLHQMLGQPDAALRQFEACRQALRQELEVEPEAETLALAEEIRARADKTLPVKESILAAPLVGRESDRAALLPFIEGVFHKLGGLLLLEGEAGVGKTRLLQEMAREAEWRGAQVLWGHARETQGLKPYAPLVEALQAGLTPLRASQIQQVIEKVWLQVIASLLSPHPALPAFEAAPSLAPAQEGTRLAEAFIHFLEGWAGAVPLVVILEDLHWADGDTLTILPALARRLGPLGVLVIGSYRTEEARATPQAWEGLQAASRGNLLKRHALSRLDEAATGELIRRSLGLAGPAPLFEIRLHRETDGNPLFILESLRALQDEGVLKRQADGGWRTPWDETTRDYAELPVPPLVEKVITNRLRRLPDSLRQALEVMAALGAQFDFTTLTGAGGLDVPTALDLTRELIRRSFLRETNVGYRFEHDKIHQVVYAEIESGRCIQIHRGIAARLAELHPAETDALAWHFWRGEEWEPAARFNRAAGENALRVYANHEALVYFSRALEALDHLPPLLGDAQRRPLLLARETAHSRLGERAAQKADLEALDALAGSPSELAAQSLRWARYYEVIGDYPTAKSAAETAIEMASREHNLPVMTDGQIVLGRILNMLADAQGTEAILTCALENARAAGDARQEVVGLHALARFYFDHQNRYDEALACCRAALEISQPLNDREMEANLRHMMSNIFSDLGYIDETWREKLAVLELRRKLGDRRGEAMILYSLAIFHRDRGDNVTSLKYVRASLLITEAIGDLRVEAYNRTYLGLLLEETDPVEALRQYTRALEIRRQIGQHALMVDTLAGLARARLQLGQIRQAKQHVAQALDWVEGHGTFAVGDISLVYLAAYDVFCAAKERRQARQVLQLAYENLMSRIQTMPDETSRRKFVDSVPQHGRILALHRDLHSRRTTLSLPRAGHADETVRVTWTLFASEDVEVRGKVELRKQRLKRLVKEAAEQGGEPTHQHLADALGVSLRTIERDIAELKKNSS